MRLLSAVLTLLLALTASAGSNVVIVENAHPGTDRWQLASSPRGSIEGFASHTSVEAGETLRVYVNTTAPSYTIEFFRLGWYGGLGGRRMTAAVEATGRTQPIAPPDPETGRVECKWNDPYELEIPREWTSGVYLAKLTTKPGADQNHVVFVVRDRRHADLLFQSSVTTAQAYNNWGGKSLYAFNSTGAPAVEVSFDRPYAIDGTGGFIRGWEYQMLRFLEREGYDVTYATSIDTHTDQQSLKRVRAFLSVGHDEYWTREMRDNVERARDTGTHLAFFSANNCYWQIRLEGASPKQPPRTIVAYKETALSSDPVLHDGNPSNDSHATTLWRNVPVSRPEEAMIGVMYGDSQIDGDVTVERTDHWAFAGTGLAPGDRLEGLLGYEVDRIHGAASPPGLTRLAHSPYVTKKGVTGTSDMTIYETSRAIVFATGTIQWSWGLDDWNSESHGGSRVSAAAQQITRNVLDRMIAPATRGPRLRSVRR